MQKVGNRIVSDEIFHFFSITSEMEICQDCLEDLITIIEEDNEDVEILQSFSNNELYFSCLNYEFCYLTYKGDYIKLVTPLGESKIVFDSNLDTMVVAEILKKSLLFCIKKSCKNKLDYIKNYFGTLDELLEAFKQRDLAGIKINGVCNLVQEKENIDNVSYSSFTKKIVDDKTIEIWVK